MCAVRPVCCCIHGGKILRQSTSLHIQLRIRDANIFCALVFHHHQSVSQSVQSLMNYVRSLSSVSHYECTFTVKQHV